MLKLDHNASIYAAPGIWMIDDVVKLKNDNFWPISTSSGDLSCYTTPPKKECGDCIFVDLNGIASSGTVVDPNGSSPSSGLLLPKKAWVVGGDGWYWDNWWWDGNYSWNWYWRYPWYYNWYSYGWYWGWGCGRYYHHIDQTTLFDITCNDTFTDKYPTCGTGNISVSGFAWGDTFNTVFLGISFTPSSSGLIPSTSNYNYTYTTITPGVTTSETKVSAWVPVNSSGVVPWNSTWNRSYGAYTINKSILLGYISYETTYDYTVNTTNAGGSNALDIVFSSYTYNSYNGYTSYYHGSLPDNDPLWSNLSWKDGYPNSLLSANPGSFWFAITQKRVQVASGYYYNTFYDNNGSGYPVPGNYGQNTHTTQITRFYLYRGCYDILDITEEAISGSPLVIGNYTPNQKSVDPLNYYYSHTTVNVCDSQYVITQGLPSIYVLCGNKLMINSGFYGAQSYPIDNPLCCPNPADPYDAYDPCLANCTPGEGGVPWDDGSQQGLTALDEWESHPKWLAEQQKTALFDCKFYKGGNYTLNYIQGAPSLFASSRNGNQLYTYDASLYYGYHFSDISGIQELTHPKIAWSIGQYTLNQSECQSHTPVNGEVWSTFYENSLEIVEASTTSPFWWWGWNFGFFGPYYGWGWCNSNYFCLDNNNKFKMSWLNSSWLNFDEDCASNLDNDYPITNTYCGPCSTNRTIVDASGISNYSISITGQSKGSSISIDRHCYLYKNPYSYAGKTIKLYYEPISGIIPIINNRLYDTDTYYASGNYTINLTGITLNNPSWWGSTQGTQYMVNNWINNNLVFGIRTSGTGTNSVFSYRCPDVKLYWPYCTGSIIPVRIVPSC